MTELVKYTESRRDELEDELANKRELLTDRRQGLAISVYWLRLTNKVSMLLVNEGENTAREFLIPNDKVMDAFEHPEFYASRTERWGDDDGS